MGFFFLFAVLAVEAVEKGSFSAKGGLARDVGGVQLPRSVSCFKENEEYSV